MKSYQTARNICSFLEFMGWLMVAAGIVLAVVLGESVGPYAPAMAGLIAAMPGLGISLVGLFCVGGVQGWRASVDTAEYTQQMLKVARDQLEVSREGFTGGRSGVPSFSAVSENSADTEGPVSFADFKNDTDANAQNLLADQVDGSEGRAVAMPAESVRPILETIEYRGATIERTDEGFFVNQLQYDTVDEAKRRVDVLVKVSRLAPGLRDL